MRQKLNHSSYFGQYPVCPACAKEQYHHQQQQQNNNAIIIINNNNNKRTISSTISISTTKDAHAAHCGVEVNMEATVFTVLLIYIQVDAQWKPGANSRYDNEDEDEEKERHILNCGILLSNEV